MPDISIAGRRYFYRDVGQGVPMLLLHGFPFTGDSFFAQLQQPLKGVRLLVPDQRGFGHSELAPGVSTMEAMADDALTLLDALKIDSAIVGGVSMGGYVALALTRLNPGRVKGLLLIDTQASADDDAGRVRRETVAADVLQNGNATLVDGMLPKLMASGASADLKQRVEQMMRAQSREAIAAASRGMGTRSDAKDILTRFAGPLQVIVGAQDVITPVEKARAMADLVAGARLAIIEGAGHLSNLEAPEIFAQHVEAFVTSIA